MMTSQNMLWIGILILGLIINGLIRGYFREKRLEYIQQNTDSKTFSQYLLFSQIFSFIFFIMIIGIIFYMAYTTK
jgi:uncharacterized membrane protein